MPLRFRTCGLLACLAALPAAGQTAPPPNVAADAKGFRLQNADGAFSLRIRGDAMMDGRFALDDPDHRTASTFYMRRARIALQATLHERFGFKLMPNFGQGRAELQDAYFDAQLTDLLALRAGKFKAPVGLERLRAPADLSLPELALPTALVPNRDVGLMATVKPFDDRLEAQLALLNGAPDGGNADADTDDGPEGAARLFVRPLGGFGVGVAGTWGAQRGTAEASLLPTYRTSGRRPFFRYAADAFADGPRARLVPQAHLYAGPVGVLAEAAVVQQEVRRGDEAATLRHRAWQATATVLVTGERAGYGAVRPARPLDEGGPGAVELAARAHGFSADPDSFPRFAGPDNAASGAAAFAVGANWYPVAAVKLMLSAERTGFRAPDGAAALPAEWLVLGRTQLSF